MSDPVSTALESMRLQGALFSRAELDAPWAVSSGQLEQGVFHAVVRGSCWVRVGDAAPVALAAGDVVYLPHGSDHVMCDDPARRPTPRRGMRTTPGDDGMDVLEVDGDGPHTTLLCGTVHVDDSSVHPLVALLPPMIHVVADDDLAGRVPMLIELLASEVRSAATGSEAAASRLTDLLVIHVIRRFVEQVGDTTEVGWLRGLRDPALAEALALIHHQPDRSWTVAELASEVGVSRSVFFARFRELVGEPPTEYLTRWRMHLAGQRRAGESVASTARAVGYANEASFSNAFLRLSGQRPSDYRASAA